MNALYFSENEALPYESQTCVVFPVSTNSQTYRNIVVNKNVSFLVHDWTISNNTKSLAEVVTMLNSLALSSDSACVNGYATFIYKDISEGENLSPDEVDEEAYKFFKEKFLKESPESSQFLENDHRLVKVVVTGAKVVGKNSSDTYGDRLDNETRS